MKKLLSKKNIFLFIPILLVCLSFIMTFFDILNIDGNFRTISFKHKENYSLNPKKGMISSGDVIRGEFDARFDNLGIVALPLQSVKWRESNEEKVFTFRIKERYKNNWIGENQYKTNIFFKENIFPFGFNIIKNSKGKRYYFEIIADKGDHLSPLFLSSNESFIVSKYQIPASEIFHDLLSFLNFLFIKIFYSINFKEITASFLLYLSVPIFYYASVSVGFAMSKIMLSIFLFPVFLYVFILPIKNDNALFSLIIIWVLILTKLKLKNYFSFVLSIVFLTLTLFLNFLNLEIQAEKTAELTYSFIIIGIVREMLLISSKNKRSLVRK